jgi:hypothetical protein
MEARLSTKGPTSPPGIWYLVLSIRVRSYVLKSPGGDDHGSSSGG